MYRRILVPIDGSDAGQRGLDAACAMARAFDASLVLLHVVEHPTMVADASLAMTWEQFGESLREHGKGVLARAHEAASAAGIASETWIVEAYTSRVGEVIAQQATEHRCDLVVVGSHGLHGIERVLLGSDAERVVRLSPVPVLVVRQAPSA